MAKLRETTHGFAFFCPGCQSAHVFYLRDAPIVWSFCGDVNRPTFWPSLLTTCPDHPDPKQRRCHLNLMIGRIYFTPDCSHDLAGKVVDLPEWPRTMVSV